MLILPPCPNACDLGIFPFVFILLVMELFYFIRLGRCLADKSNFVWSLGYELG